jgi:hypothetical protein
LAFLTTLYAVNLNWVLSILLLGFYNVLFILPIAILIILATFFKTQFDHAAPIVDKIIGIYLKSVKFILFLLLLILGLLVTIEGMLGVYGITVNSFV